MDLGSIQPLTEMSTKIISCIINTTLQAGGTAVAQRLSYCTTDQKVTSSSLYIQIHIKYPLFLSDFNETDVNLGEIINLKFLDRLWKKYLN
jgi:hypothetical protein